MFGGCRRRLWLAMEHTVIVSRIALCMDADSQQNDHRNSPLDTCESPTHD